MRPHGRNVSGPLRKPPLRSPSTTISASGRQRPAPGCLRRDGRTTRPRSTASGRQPCANLSHALLNAPNLPLETLSAFPVVLRRGVKLSPVIGYVGGQLGALPLKGLAFVRGSGHVADDSAGGKGTWGGGGHARPNRMSRPLEAAPSGCFFLGTARHSHSRGLRCSSEPMHAHAFLKLRKSMGLTRAQMAGLIRVPLFTVRACEAGTLEIKSKRLIRRKRGGRLS
jgi:hypothetical protein